MLMVIAFGLMLFVLLLFLVAMSNRRLKEALTLLLSQGDLSARQIVPQIHHFSPAMRHVTGPQVLAMLYRLEKEGRIRSYWKKSRASGADVKYFGLPASATDKPAPTPDLDEQGRPAPF